MAAIIYFSQTQHTQIVAQKIAEKLKAPIYELTPQTAYPDNYQALTQLAEQEKQQQLRPTFKELSLDISNHQEILLGFPIWWGSFPMIVASFLEQYNVAAKDIYPFVTHEGSGLGASVENLQTSLPNSHVHHGLAIRGSTAARADLAITNWLKQNKIND